MKVNKLSVKGSASWNEDALVANEDLQIYGVIDGATSLVPFNGKNGETGGYLASLLIAEAFNAMGNEDMNRPLSISLIEANRRLRAEMKSYGIDPLIKEELWGAAAVVIRICEHGIEYAQAGDCMLAAVYTDGTVRVVTRDQVAHLDRESHRLWAEGIAKGLRSKEDLWSYVRPQIVSGRRLTNTAEGYAVVNGDPALADYLEHGVINRINLKALLLMSDGLYIPKPAGKPLFDAVEVTEKVMEMGLTSFVDWVIRLEESDRDCIRYPRAKTSDDKTAIWIEF